jgi:hypothetical protein
LAHEIASPSELYRVAMEVRLVARDANSRDVEPRAFADPVARVHRAG